MRKNSRAYKIYEAGMDQLKISTEPEAAELVRAIAVMIAEATKPKEKKKQPPLLYNEGDVIKRLNYDLKVARHGGLNRQLRTLNLLPDDLDQFEAWFTGSMYPWLQGKDIELTYSMVVRKYPEWLERARQYSGSGHDVSTPSESWR
tara:strand:- start:4599 stop:5036 length:438 start_codon:yes stop_codon:yes gene_type:complete